MSRGLRLMVYDQTCTGRPWLTQSWVTGAVLARARGRLDAASGATTWAEALDWLGSISADQEIEEIQFWGHGKWGRVYIDNEYISVDTLGPTNLLEAKLARIRERLQPDGRWWFRSCETFGASAGHDFARRWTDYFERPAAGHTYIIGPWQSGLHCLQPGEQPKWSLDEGILEGDADAPTRALWSKPWSPNTINCLRMKLPSGW